MARVTTYPYRTAGINSAKVDSWTYNSSNGEIDPVPSSLPDWDPDSDVTVDASITVSAEQLRQEAGLPDTRLAISLSWYCPTTQLRGPGESRPLESTGGIREYRLRCTAPGSDLGGDVTFSASIILAEGGPGAEPLTARIPGSILWQEHRQIALADTAGRFPIQWVDFESAISLPDGAAWWLDWNPDDLETSVGGGIQLLLNEKHEELHRLLPDHDAPETRAVYEMIHFELGRALILGALRNEDFVSSADDFGGTSVGAFLRRLIGAVFSGVDLKYLQNRSQREPDRFDAELQQALRLFSGLRSR